MKQPLKRASSSSVDVVVVGAGYSGLVAARELTRKGYTVTVVSCTQPSR